MGRGTIHTTRITRLLQLCVEEGGLAGAAGVEEERSYAHTHKMYKFFRGGGGQSGYAPSAMKPREIKLSKYNAVSRKPQPPNGHAYIYT